VANPLTLPLALLRDPVRLAAGAAGLAVAVPRANEQVKRVIELAAPIDRMAGRVERITGTLRRDS